MLYERGLFGFFKGIPYTPKQLTINFWIVLPRASASCNELIKCGFKHRTG